MYSAFWHDILFYLTDVLCCVADSRAEDPNIGTQLSTLGAHVFSTTSRGDVSFHGLGLGMGANYIPIHGLNSGVNSSYLSMMNVYDCQMHVGSTHLTWIIWIAQLPTNVSGIFLKRCPQVRNILVAAWQMGLAGEVRRYGEPKFVGFSPEPKFICFWKANKIPNTFDSCF